MDFAIETNSLPFLINSASRSCEFFVDSLMAQF